MQQITRINLEFPDPIVKTMDSLTRRIGASSRTETIRRAILALDIITKRRLNGTKLIFEHPDGSRSELEIL